MIRINNSRGKEIDFIVDFFNNLFFLMILLIYLITKYLERMIKKSVIIRVDNSCKYSFLKNMNNGFINCVRFNKYINFYVYSSVYPRFSTEDPVFSVLSEQSLSICFYYKGYLCGVTYF